MNKIMVIRPKLTQTNLLPYKGGIGYFSIEIVAYDSDGIYNADILEVSSDSNSFKVLSCEKDMEPYKVGNLTVNRMYSNYIIKVDAVPATKAKQTYMSSFGVTTSCTILYRINGLRYKSTFKVVGYDGDWKYTLDVKDTSNGWRSGIAYQKEGGAFFLDSHSYRTYRDYFEPVLIEGDNTDLEYGIDKLPQDAETPMGILIRVPENFDCEHKKVIGSYKNKAGKTLTKWEAEVPVEFTQMKASSNRFREFLDGNGKRVNVKVKFILCEGSYIDWNDNN